MAHTQPTILSQHGNIHILILGGGLAGSALLKLFNQRYSWLIIDGIVDINIHAVGMREAKSLNIPTFHNISTALEHFQGDIIIDVTGSLNLQQELSKSHEYECISGKSARLLFDLVAQAQQQQSVINHHSLHLNLLSTMLDLSLKLEEHKNTYELIRCAVQGIHRSLHARKAFAILFHEEGNECFGISAKDTPSSLEPKFAKNLESFFLHQNIDQKKFLILDPPLLVPDINECFDLAIPIIHQHQLIALLLLQHHETLDAETEAIMQATSLHLHLAIQSKTNHEKLEKQAVLDPLTHVYNRRQFNQLLLKEFDRLHRKQEGELNCIFIDIDFFKEINDQYGHDIGDQLLIQVAKALKHQLRAYDTIARYGGDEFVALLPSEGSTPVVVEHIAERLLQQLRAIQIPKFEQINIDFSIGIATIYPTSKETAKELICLADQALYQAKADGRGCIRINKTTATKQALALG